MSIKTQFSIKDLENLSGVKAHTIRIWEKRYNLLSPERTETNIRRYSIESLKKILDIAYLYNEGYKISKIALLDDDALKQMIISSIENAPSEDLAINNFKKAMLAFDTVQFNTIFNKLKLSLSFDEIFETVFIPLLTQIGTLWHTKAIDVAHERFISELIKRKTIFHIEQESQENPYNPKRQTFCLFLPNKEIHEIGLLFTNYLLIKAGFNTIYLGHDIPLESLNKLRNSDKLTYIAYLTVSPDTNESGEYFNQFNITFNSETPPELWLVGSKTSSIDPSSLPRNISRYDSLESFLNKVKSLNKS
ncbi:MerR family transcriptional regulator [Patiriisocius marinus]|uniref:MerR family transcriptional regulator n=1 Tax=Patiriisocius marinus TaxID=1397112 RepID=A0A5J4J569_9FLAO|nr:MerR family transcriptional regulator [Patiriisocius marinus]GER60941.1 MerR family transcriptional regulator [Patiriisocius marinus]